MLPNIPREACDDGSNPFYTNMARTDSLLSDSQSILCILVLKAATPKTCSRSSLKVWAKTGLPLTETL